MIDSDYNSRIDKISDDVYVLDKNVILRFNVSLSKLYCEGSTKNWNRCYYRKDYEYRTTTTDNKDLITVKRSFDYYLSFESPKKDEHGEKLFIRIGCQEFLALYTKLTEVYRWFTDRENYGNLFVRDKDKITIAAPIPEVFLTNLPMDKYIRFHPDITDKNEIGVTIIFEGTHYVSTINVDRFMGLYYIISRFNMYQSACALINYHASGFNPPEECKISIPQERYDYYENANDEITTTGISGRVVLPKNKKHNISVLEG